MIMIMQIVKRETSVGHSRTEKAQSRERVLKAAARRLRETGPERLGVADIMREAGLTHGGFYGHFASRDALVTAALARAFEHGRARSARAAGRHGERTLKSVVEGYLSPAHRDGPGSGCAIAALAADVARGDDAANRALLTHAVEQAAESMGALADSSDGLAVISTLVGALILARAVDQPALSNAILAAARAAILGP